ncbi:non-hydrolyzing UDP-N-acetylglucosamine 2-epimerase [Adhaeribacter soli]|uniref:UDP-N-acetylglucosamine 2-epimerase (Non-hydrolyzing) n=1 Tax=Adhaeribacter soli TaxID=2607655 RepID=A0A5N1J1V0_9BACT|nr:UDP-N-acetylglucosamine 2-epimerase (non-hydrolyzing) [Adhaeribacter soli]KAA9340718.1 UDP-N-acetylglucosamine 2-epimerase (non-hydrolyzing) [Adhaeribacter soli]
MDITIVAGARPNFMKISPIIKAIKNANKDKLNIRYRLVHTGQHFDQKMSGDFFKQLGIPDPDVNLGCGGGTQAEQTAAIMTKFEKELVENRPDVVLVVGDVTSTMACTITAKKLSIDVAHVEAGIRSGDWSMPEEINRVVTDSICNHFFTTSNQASQNLLKSAVSVDRIHFVGNTMIDTLYQNLSRLQKPPFWDEFKLEEKKYFLATLHRPSNVDDPEKLKTILNSIRNSISGSKVIFPVHPRTRKVLESINFHDDNIIMIDPQGYLEFIYLVKNAKGIITDSGGITEEATVLGIPCLTLRNSTERPETVTLGTNELIGDDYAKLSNFLQKILQDEWKSGSIPPLWDGNTSKRIVSILYNIYESKKEALLAA